MSVFPVYALCAFLLALFGLAVAYNFLRFRFKGDKTLVFLSLFAALFILSMVFTLSLVDFQQNKPGFTTDF